MMRRPSCKQQLVAVLAGLVQVVVLVVVEYCIRSHWEVPSTLLALASPFAAYATVMAGLAALSWVVGLVPAHAAILLLGAGAAAVAVYDGRYDVALAVLATAGMLYSPKREPGKARPSPRRYLVVALLAAPFLAGEKRSAPVVAALPRFFGSQGSIVVLLDGSLHPAALPYTRRQLYKYDVFTSTSGASGATGEDIEAVISGGVDGDDLLRAMSLMSGGGAGVETCFERLQASGHLTGLVGDGPLDLGGEYREGLHWSERERQALDGSLEDFSLGRLMGADEEDPFHQARRFIRWTGRTRYSLWVLADAEGVDEDLAEFLAWLRRTRTWEYPRIVIVSLGDDPAAPVPIWAARYGGHGSHVVDAPVELADVCATIMQAPFGAGTPLFRAGY